MVHDELGRAFRRARRSRTDDTGNGKPPIVDTGAYEFQVTCPWDLDCNGSVGASDLLTLLST